MNLAPYLPGILGICVVFSLCAILFTAEKQNRQRMLPILLLPMILLIARFAPYLAGLEWRLALRRPLDYACAFLPPISILLGAKLCKTWKRVDGWQAPVSAIALVSCFFLTVSLIVNQVLLGFRSDYIVEDSDNKPLFVLEDTDPGSFTGRRFYTYVDEMFRGLSLEALGKLTEK